MGYAPVPSHKQIQAALRTALLAILPTGVSVIEGQNNNVASPKGDFVVMTVIRRDRLETNIVQNRDCKFLGVITAGRLVVQQLASGVLEVGRPVFGTGVSPSPTIKAINPDGSATLSAPITLTSRWLAAGSLGLKQATRVVFQLDVHSEDMGRASDMAQTMSTVLRDDVGVQLLKASGLPISPLFADDPKQIPFQTGEQQTEDRYVVECHLQADQTITPDQEFADEVVVDRVAADLFFPA
ncbi:phage neck terminator protein [Methylobacterium brachiatum]|uniref:phage neck terminator protein n=1 Tax=Methylobacterium brachiatum TaxID=269660 RepID=UPI000EFD2F7A|nr:hypothetical protein [Methylobacterium brachiatum]AYO83578.1 hypothetical protein EBB05_15760 [Methylobacterium brachiatum]